MNYKAYAEKYKDNLLNDVVPFWLKNSAEKEFGDYFTRLGIEGEIFDSVKLT